MILLLLTAVNINDIFPGASFSLFQHPEFPKQFKLDSDFRVLHTLQHFEEVRKSGTEPGNIVTVGNSNAGFDCFFTLAGENGDPWHFILNWKRIEMSAATKIKGAIDQSSKFIKV